MDMRNCRKCGKIFTYINIPICKDCEMAEEKLFDTVRDYIKEHEHCTLAEVSAETGVSGKKIMNYIKEGRLEISKGMHGSLTCEQCGKPIFKGKYCDSCVIRLNQEVVELFSQKKPAAKMHTKGDPRR